MVDGRRVRDSPLRRLIDGTRMRLMGELQRRERLLDACLGAHPGVTHADPASTTPGSDVETRTRMTTLARHLVAGDAHDRLPFRPDCPI